MRKHGYWGLTALVLLAAGCGGSGGGAGSGESGPAPEAAAPALGSAKFTVNAITNEVSITPLTDAGRAAFRGGAVSFTSSTFLREGSPERRIIKAVLKNDSQETIGAGASSIRLVFSDFLNENSPITSLQGTVRTNTFYGNGTASSVDGPLTAATTTAPGALAYADSSSALYEVTSTGLLRRALNGTVSTYPSAGVSFKPVLAELNDQKLLGAFGSCVASIFPTDTDHNGVALAGSPTASGTSDGTFSAARFGTSISDIAVVSGTSSDVFQAVVVESDRLRLLTKTGVADQGSVSTTFTGSSLRGAAVYKGVLLVSMGNKIMIRSNALSSSAGVAFLGSDTAAFAAGRGDVARFNAPGKMAVIGGSVFLADTGNNVVRQLVLRDGASPMSPANWQVANLSGTGAAGTTDGTGAMTHNQPFAVVKGNGDSLYVSDLGSNRIRQIIPLFDKFISDIGFGASAPADKASLANADSYAQSLPDPQPIIIENGSVASGASRSLKQWEFVLPEGLTSFSFVVTVEGDVDTVATLPSVNNTSASGKGSLQVVVRGFAGGESSGYLDGPLHQAAFSTVRGMCRAANGVIFVADMGNSAIRRIDPSGFVTTIAGSPTDTVSADGPEGSGKVLAPVGVACSPDGSEVYFVEGDQVVRKLVFVPSVTVNGQVVPNDPAKRTSWNLVTIAGKSQTGGSVNNTTGDLARFSDLAGIVCISPTSLLVCETSGRRVRVINRGAGPDQSSSYSVGSFAGSGSQGSTDSSSGPAATFNQPFQMAVGPDGYISVADLQASRIRRVSPSGSTSTLAGSTAGYRDTAAGTPQFSSPTGISVDSAGYVYVADSINQVIRRVSPSGRTTTVAGAAGVEGSVDGRGDQARFTSLNCLMTTPNGDLYVGDGNRIRLIQRLINQ